MTNFEHSNNVEDHGRAFEPVLNASKAAALLQIHPKTLEKMARQGRVPAFRIGDLWRFRASELDAWLRTTAASPTFPSTP